MTSLVDAAFDASDEKLGVDPVVLNVAKLVDAFDALFITAGQNDRQVRAIADEIERRVAVATDLRPLRIKMLRGRAVGRTRLRRGHRPRLSGTNPRVLRPRAPLERRSGAPPHRVLEVGRLGSAIRRVEQRQAGRYVLLWSADRPSVSRRSISRRARKRRPTQRRSRRRGAGTTIRRPRHSSMANSARWKKRSFSMA